MFIKLLPFSETQTDESDVEPESCEVPSQLEQDFEVARNGIESLKEQLKISQLEVSKKEAEMKTFKEAAAATEKREREKKLISNFCYELKKGNYCNFQKRTWT